MNAETKLIKDFTDDYCLVTDSQEIVITLRDYCVDADASEWGCLFVRVDDSGADYAEIWGCERAVPMVSHYCYKLR